MTLKNYFFIFSNVHIQNTLTTQIQNTNTYQIRKWKEQLSSTEICSKITVHCRKYFLPSLLFGSLNPSKGRQIWSSRKK